jgi:rare lipoprotein A
MRANRGAWTLPLILMAGFVLAGCGSTSGGPSATAQHHRGKWQVGRPNYTVSSYQVNGVWYYPKVDYDYDETGTASWYGPGFDGKATADGEIYDMNQLSAAHKTLPLPSVVEVTNLQNGRALRLRVNDRGPFVGDRLIDVSRRGAQLLGFAGSGTAHVRVKIVKEESIQVAQAAMRGELGPGGAAVTAVAAASPPPARPAPVHVAASAAPSLRAAEVVAPAPAEVPPPAAAAIHPTVSPAPAPAPAAAPPPRTEVASSRRYWPSLIASAHAETRGGRIFVQAGAFAVAENARRVRARIAALGHAEVIPATAHGTALYRVRVGPVSSQVEARRLLSKVVDSGYPDARMVDE